MKQRESQDQVLTSNAMDLINTEQKQSEIYSSNMVLVEMLSCYIVNYASGVRHTERSKKKDLEHFLKFLKTIRRVKDVGELTWRDLSTSVIEKFIEDRLRVNESPATVRRRLATIKHFCRTLSETLPEFLNPARSVKPPGVDILRPKSLPDSELAEVIDYTNELRSTELSFKKLRDITLVETFLATGLRADEIRKLRRGQIADCGEWLHDVRTKGRKFRKVYLPEQLRQSLATYLNARSAYLTEQKVPLSGKTDKGLPLFVSAFRANVTELDSYRLSEKSVWRIVKKIAKTHPHKLRHTFATKLLDRTNDIRLVAQALGHSDVRVTMKYTERTDEDIARALEDSKIGLFK
jgi:site-specific recombinase XerD